MKESFRATVAVVGAGCFGLSLAISLQKRGHNVTLYDQHDYQETKYRPSANGPEQVASVDHNKIFRASYGSKIHYQRLALESRQAWLELEKQPRSEPEDCLFVPSGMLRVQPTDVLSELDQETLKTLERDGYRETQYVKSCPRDRERAKRYGWRSKLLDFAIPGDAQMRTFDAVLDSLAGYTQCSQACAFFLEIAEAEGVKFCFGPETGCLTSVVEKGSPRKAVGLKTKDGLFHSADVVVIAAGSFSTQLLPDLAYHLESSAGSIVTFKIDPSDKNLWDKYSPDRFPVITWKCSPRTSQGKDVGSVYVLPRTKNGLIKIGYRGVKPAPIEAAFSQEGKWSIPLPVENSQSIPQIANDAIVTFISIFMPEFRDKPFYATKLCWYTDSLDNSFLIDYVPTYADHSVFVCTGGSGHGAKFMPVLGEHAADIFEKGSRSTSPMWPFWQWRDTIPRRNGLEEGPCGARNLNNNTDWTARNGQATVAL